MKPVNPVANLVGSGCKHENMPEDKPTPTMDKLQHAASHQGRFAPQRSLILPHNPVKLAASQATLELTDEKRQAAAAGDSRHGDRARVVLACDSIVYNILGLASHKI